MPGATSYAILWVGGLAVSVASVWAALSLASWLRPGWRRVAVTLPAFAVPLVWGLAWTAAGAFLRFDFGYRPDWFLYSLSWTLCFVAGAVLVWRRRARPSGTDPAQPAAGRFPRMALALPAAALAPLIATLLLVDAAVRREVASFQAEAETVLRSCRPPAAGADADAAPVYGQAFAALDPAAHDAGWQRYEWVSNCNKFGFDVDASGLREYLLKQEPALALLRRAAVMPGFGENLVETDSVVTSDTKSRWFARLGSWWQASEDLALDARLKASEGRAREALEDLSAILAMSRQLKKGYPLAWSSSARRIAERGVAGLECVLALTAPTAEELAGLSVDDSAQFGGLLPQSLRAEEALYLWQLCPVAYSSPPRWWWFYTNADMFDREADRRCALRNRVMKLKSHAVGAVLWRVFFMPEDLADVREVMRTARALAARPGFEVREEWAAFARGLEAERRGMFSALFIGEPRVPQRSPSPLQSAWADAGRVDAQQRLARLAIAVTAYRLKEGRYPERLDQLVPAFVSVIPIDPFDGRPLKMAAADGGLVLYSVGPDGVDEGGAEPDRKAGRTGDITFCLGPAWQVRRKAIDASR